MAAVPTLPCCREGDGHRYVFIEQNGIPMGYPACEVTSVQKCIGWVNADHSDSIFLHPRLPAPPAL